MSAGKARAEAKMLETARTVFLKEGILIVVRVDELILSKCNETTESKETDREVRKD